MSGEETGRLVEALGQGMAERLPMQRCTIMDDQRAPHRYPTVGAFSRPLGDGF